MIKEKKSFWFHSRPSHPQKAINSPVHHILDRGLKECTKGKQMQIKAVGGGTAAKNGSQATRGERGGLSWGEAVEPAEGLDKGCRGETSHTLETGEKAPKHNEQDCGLVLQTAK